MKNILTKFNKSLALVALLSLSPSLQGSTYSVDTYEDLGGNAANDDLNDAIDVLSGAISLSKAGAYRAVVKCGAGSATWIGNSDSKSYFITVGHVINAATNTITTYDGTTIPPVSGSFLHREFNDFGLLEYNSVLNPSLFGGESAVLMDLNIVDNFLGQETTLVGYGNLTVGDRSLGRTRCLSTAFVDFETSERTRSVPNPDLASQPFAGSASAGDSGGGVFITLQGREVLLGAVSSGNSSLFNYAHVFAQRDLIDSIVPDGVFSWYSDLISFQPDPNKVYHIENPTFGLRLAANGVSENAYTTTLDVNNEDTRWVFVRNANGHYHIQRAAGGVNSRLRTDNTSSPDMHTASKSGAYTYYSITPSVRVNGAYYLTLPDGPAAYQRLRILNTGGIDFSTTANVGSQPSLRIVEATPSEGIVNIVKRTASFGMHSNDGSNGGNLNVHSNLTHNNLKFKEIDRGGGYYSYERFNSAHSIASANGGENGQNVIVWSTNDDSYNQQWQKVDAGDGSFTLRKRNALSFGIHAGGRIQNLSNVNLHSNLEHQNLHWYVTPVE